MRREVGGINGSAAETESRMEVTRRDVAVVSVLAVGTAVAVYFAAGQSINGAIIGLLVGAVGGILPCVLIRVLTKK
jgi:uncharacterized YccA/Bax inhibitor family protein